MTDDPELERGARDRAGKGAARATRRRGGRVPAVIYGDKQPATLISLEPQGADRAAAQEGLSRDPVRHRRATARSSACLPRDVQFDPVTDVPMHVDFLRVGKDTRSMSTCRS